MFGCDEYPAGYPYTEHGNTTSCDTPKAMGWLGAFFMLWIIIFGGYVLPSVLIGIVAISFDEATRHAANVQSMVRKMQKVVADTEQKLPGFFSPARLERLQAIFSEMDADGELALDLSEIAPFYRAMFKELFGILPTPEQVEALFHLMDIDGTGDLGYAEFILFVSVIKQIQRKVKGNIEYAAKTGLYKKELPPVVQIGPDGKPLPDQGKPGPGNRATGD